MNPVRRTTSLLWIDCAGGLVVGILVLSFAHWLSALYALLVGFVVTMGTANLAYGTFSLYLARCALRPRALLLLLVVANISWAVLCAITAVVMATQASYFGLAHLLLESVYVGGLGALEWRHRSGLLVAAWSTFRLRGT